MTQGSSDDQFGKSLDTVVEILNDELTPSVRALMTSIRGRYHTLRGDNQEGLTAEHLVLDLVGILCDFEVRLRTLEQKSAQAAATTPKPSTAGDGQPQQHG